MPRNSHAQPDALEGTRDRVPPQLQAVADSACESIRAVVGMVRRIDNALMLIDRTLRVSQPPIARKLGIRFWVPTSGAPREPVLVSWRRIRNRRWRAERVRRLSRHSVNYSGNAALCAENTFRLATVASDLIHLRAALVHRLRALRQAAGRARDRYAAIDHAEAAVIAEHAQVVERLEGHGYAVDDRVKGLVNQYLG